MRVHRWISSCGSGRKLGLSALALALLGGCGDDEPGRDTIDDATADVDTDTSADTDTPADTTTPDTRDAETSAPGVVVINEVAPAGDPADWVELHNPGAASVDISGWTFKDNDDAHAYSFPSGTVIPAGGFKVVERVDPGLGEGFDFGLGGADSARLFDASGALVDDTAWLDGAAPATRSWGRIPDATGAFVTLLTPTPGAANRANPSQTCGNDQREGLEACDGADFGGLSCVGLGWGGGTLACLEACTRVGTADCTPRAPGLVLNEVESDEQDRIEIFNGSGDELDLGGYTVTDQGDNVYALPAGTRLAAGGYLVLERDVDHTFGLGDVDGLVLADPLGVEIDRVAWTSGQAIPAWCRLPNGVGGFRICDNQTFGAANF